MFFAETQRLLMREMTTDDAEYAYLLNLDPEVIQYTGDKSFESIIIKNMDTVAGH
jgi:ribosomal-protein-alanine N-acetyltransferase